MNILNLAKKITIDSQFYVSLMATFLAAFFMIEQNAFRLSTICLIFITYFNGYLYTKYQGSKKFLPILLLNTIAGILSILIIFLHHDYQILWKWSIIVILGILYNSTFLTRYIRKIPLIKIFYVGIVWGLMNTWLISEKFDIENFSITFFYITALVLPFDIRDIKEDKIVTFPKLIGIKGTKILAYSMIGVASILAILFLKIAFAFSFCISSIIALAFVFFSNEKRPETFYSFGVETCCGSSLIIYGFLQFLSS